MLARSGRLPTHGDWAFEVKWDGFRALVSTEHGLRVRSRRGWDMTEHVGFLNELPVRAVLDGELVALDEQGKPDFPLVYERILMRRHESRYALGERGWVKVKNRAYWRYEMERESAINSRRVRRFI